MLRVILVNALFSIIFPIGKVAMAYAPPFFISGLRMMMGGFFYVAFMALFKPRDFKLPLAMLGFMALLSLFNVYLANAYEFWGLQYMSSAKTAFIYNLSPFFSALFSYLHFKEKMTRNKWIGLIISMVGFIPIFLWSSPEESQLCSFGFLSLAELSLIVAMIATVYGWIIMQYVVYKKKYNAVMSNGVSMLGGGMICFAHSFFSESWSFISTTSWSSLLCWVLLIVVLSNIIAFSLYTSLLKKYSATFLSFSGLMGPFFAAVFDWMLFGVYVPLGFYVATALVAVGLYLFYKDEINAADLVA